MEPLNPEARTLSEHKGALVIIGGAEDRDGACKILREFVSLSGGEKARIVVLTAATSEPREAGDTYIDVFERLGAANVRVVDTRNQDDANQIDAIRAIRQATGIFFTGGNQARIVESIKGTILDDAIHKRHAEGVVVAGTSAGAAIMPEIMIVKGESETSPRSNAVTLGPGLGFVQGMVLDQHFAQRGRLGRLLAALLLQPAFVGVGIDENTAIVVKGIEFQVIGEGAVTIIDESKAAYNHAYNPFDATLNDESMSVFGVKLHILTEGCRFNSLTKQPRHC